MYMQCTLASMQCARVWSHLVVRHRGVGLHLVPGALHGAPEQVEGGAGGQQPLALLPGGGGRGKEGKGKG